MKIADFLWPRSREPLYSRSNLLSRIKPERAGATVSGPFRSVWRSGRCGVGELPDGTGDPAPGHRAVVIAFGRELVGTRGALLERVLTVTLEHQGGGAPDVDLGYHAEKVCKPAV